jgi:hypothetical protein
MRTMREDLEQVEADVLAGIRCCKTAADELRAAYTRLQWLRRKIEALDTGNPVPDQGLTTSMSIHTTEPL